MWGTWRNTLIRLSALPFRGWRPRFRLGEREDTRAPGDPGDVCGVPSTAFDELWEKIQKEFSSYRTFMVLGPARSGTTATIRTLGLATNVEVFSEPLPRLGTYVRRYQLNLLSDPKPVIWRHRIERIRAVRAKGKIYGEKDQQVYCWLPYYRHLFNPRIVFARRDGRDSVRSLFNQHYEVLGNLYREVADVHNLSPQARENAVTLPAIEHDPVDMMRQRPTPEDPVFFEWIGMSRFEMIAWYWSTYVRIVQRDLYNMERERWDVLDFTGEINVSRFERLYGFLGLGGFNREAVERSLDSRPGALVHQLKDKDHSLRLPSWQEWSDETVRSFDRYAASTMVECGYYGVEKLPTCDGAKSINEHAIMVEHDSLVERVTSMLGSDVLPRFAPFHDILLIGTAPAMFHCANVTVWKGGQLSDLPGGDFDLVLAVGVIDQAPDMDAMLIELAKRTRRILVVASRWGHFDQLIEHRYMWAKDGRGLHSWCVAKARSLLHNALGFDSVESAGLDTGDHLRPRISVLMGCREAAEHLMLPRLAA